MVGPGVIETWCRKCGPGVVPVPPMPAEYLGGVRRYLRRCPGCGRGGRKVSQLLDGSPAMAEAREAWEQLP